MCSGSSRLNSCGTKVVRDCSQPPKSTRPINNATAISCQKPFIRVNKPNTLAEAGQISDHTAAAINPIRTSGTHPPAAKTGHAFRHLGLAEPQRDPAQFGLFASEDD